MWVFQIHHDPETDAVVAQSSDPYYCCMVAVADRAADHHDPPVLRRISISACMTLSGPLFGLVEPPDAVVAAARHLGQAAVLRLTGGLPEPMRLAPR